MDLYFALTACKLSHSFLTLWVVERLLTFGERINNSIRSGSQNIKTIRGKTDVFCCIVFKDFHWPQSFLHSRFLCLRLPWRKYSDCRLYFISTAPLPFTDPCRIQCHSFLMSLLSLLISVSSSKMNDSRPCNKYNMHCMNISENKNGRLLLLIPFQMFRFRALSMSASFQTLGHSRNIFPSH